MTSPETHTNTVPNTDYKEVGETSRCSKENENNMERHIATTLNYRLRDVNVSIPCILSSATAIENLLLDTLHW